MSTIFSLVIARKVPAEIVYEDDLVIAIKDLYPKAPVHLLVIPKKEYASLQEVPKSDLSVIAHMMRVIQQLAAEYHVEKGYRVIANVGAEAGQSISHLHFHLLGGRKLTGMG